MEGQTQERTKRTRLMKQGKCPLSGRTSKPRGPGTKAGLLRPPMSVKVARFEEESDCLLAQDALQG